MYLELDTDIGGQTSNGNTTEGHSLYMEHHCVQKRSSSHNTSTMASPDSGKHVLSFDERRRRQNRVRHTSGPKENLSHQLQSNDAKKGMLQKFWDAASSYREQHPGESLSWALRPPSPRRGERQGGIPSPAYACYVDDNLLSRSCFTLIRLRAACKHKEFL